MISPNKLILPPSFAIRFRRIDEEHQRAIDELNACIDLIEDGALTPFIEQCDGFLRCLTCHFANEEKLMQEVEYGGLEWHHAHHQKSLQQAAELVKRCREENEIDIDDIHYLFNKVVYDIVKSDLKFAAYLADHGFNEDEIL